MPGSGLPGKVTAAAGHPGIVLAGLLIALVCVLVGSAVGALCNPPLLRHPAAAMLSTLAAIIFALAAGVSPANAAIAHTTAQAASPAGGELAGNGRTARRGLPGGRRLGSVGDRGDAPRHLVRQFQLARRTTAAAGRPPKMADTGARCRVRKYPPSHAIWEAGGMQAAETGTDGGGAPRFAAVDVHYPASGGALAALVLAGDRTFSQVLAEKTTFVAQVAGYVPGQFFRRELPPIRAVLAEVTGIELLVIDGYVDLAPDGRPGLGARVHEELGVPVVGVAKTFFTTATHAIPVVRGQSARPLTSRHGLPAAEAAELILRMSGKFRLPDALRQVDALARGRKAPVLAR